MYRFKSMNQLERICSLSIFSASIFLTDFEQGSETPWNFSVKISKSKFFKV
jgi:hypothetical protein